MMADGNTQQALGYVYLPIIFSHKRRLVNVLIASFVKYKFILGVEFCCIFNISLNFSNDTVQSLNCIKSSESEVHEAIQGQKFLTSDQRKELQRVIDAFIDLGKVWLGRAENFIHRIDSGDAIPIKQNYHILSCTENLIA